jgi:cbb3-type cytochrome oxidase subunit 3
MMSPEMQANLFIGWLVLSIIAFFAIMIWAMWPSHRGRFEAYGRIPLRDDDGETGT